MMSSIAQRSHESLQDFKVKAQKHVMNHAGGPAFGTIKPKTKTWTLFKFQSKPMALNFKQTESSKNIAA